MATTRDWLILDLATAAIPDAASYLEGAVRAPSNYGPDAAEKYIREKTADRVALAATDLDLARITAVGILRADGICDIATYETEADEQAGLTVLAARLRQFPRIITFGGRAFDLPLLNRRSLYLGVDMPWLDCDRFRSPHPDLMEMLSGGDRDRRRSLGFYARRLGLGLTKSLSGAEEAQVPVSGRWDDLRASVAHDLEATRRIAEWLKVLP